jgi:hypothetical protein
MGATVIPKPIIENQLALKGVYRPISKIIEDSAYSYF